MDWPDSPEAAPLGDGRRASAVDRPESVQSLGECIARRAGEGLAVYPQGGRTALDYGGIPRRPGVALDVTRLDRVIDYPAADMTVTAEAGITLAKLQSVLAAEGQFLPLDAPDPDKATLGGIYATDTSGPRRFGWGRPRDLIIGVGFAAADGKAIKGGGRVVKNVAGYDFPKLLTGSMGTLGVITHLTLKVRPKPGASALVMVPFARRDALASAVMALNTSATRPVAIEALNASGYRLLSTEASIGEPEFVLIVGFEDNAASVAWQVERLLVEVNRTRADVAIFEDDRSEPIWQALTAFHADASFGPLSATIGLPRSKAIGVGMDLDPKAWAVKVQAGSGAIVAHASSGRSDAEIQSEVASLRGVVSAAGGGVAVTRCPPAWKPEIQVWGEPRGEWTIMERIKAALDPAGVLNPGRFIGTI